MQHVLAGNTTAPKCCRVGFYYCCGSCTCMLRHDARRENCSLGPTKNLAENVKMPTRLIEAFAQTVGVQHVLAGRARAPKCRVLLCCVPILCMPERIEETDVIDQRAHPSRRRRSRTRNIVNDDVVTCKPEVSSELYNMHPFIPYLPTRPMHAHSCRNSPKLVWTRFHSLHRRVNLVSSTCYCLRCFFRVGFTHIGKRF